MTTVSAPLVSVIIATYNWSSVLPYSIGSALRQTFSDIEVLVVGDGCTDDSESVVAGIADPRVRWINLEVNTGHQTGPNNEGLRQARGKYVAYLGHDDLWMPHHVSCLVAALDAGADLAYGAVRYVRPPGDSNVVIAIPVPYFPGMWIPPSSVMHRHDYIKRIGGWQDHLKIHIDPDADMWLRIYEAGGSFAFVPRLTTIKLPASMRRDVYKVRPSHEQADWFHRIQTEDDLEAIELTQMVILAEQYKLAQSGPRPYRTLCREFLSETVARFQARFKALLRGQSLSRYLFERRRRFKGLS